ncbi:unnamed protein product [Closterium sp. Naga37s-1]|nr:unnamed protein product [Closterium sp. Naga37s-1]
MDCHELRWQQMNSRRELSLSSRMRSLERGRSRTRSPQRAAYRADLVTRVGGRQEGGEADLHVRTEPRPRPSCNDPWNLAGGQQGAGERRRKYAGVADSSDSASEADGKEEKEGVAEEERDADADRAPEEMRGSDARRQGQIADADRAPEKMCGSDARRQGQIADADRAPEEMRGSEVRRQRKIADADGAPEEMRGSDVRRQGQIADADRAPEEMRGSDARCQGQIADADHVPEEMRGSGAKRRGNRAADHSPKGPRGGEARRSRSKAAEPLSRERGEEEKSRAARSQDKAGRAGSVWRWEEGDHRSGRKRRRTRITKESAFRTRQQGGGGRRGGREAGVANVCHPAPQRQMRERVACVPAAAEAEEKDEQVGAGVGVLAAAKIEERDEEAGARACVPAAAEAEGKGEKEGAVKKGGKTGLSSTDMGGSSWQPSLRTAELFGEIGAGVKTGVTVKDWTQAEEQAQGLKLAEQHVRKLRGGRPELLGEEMIEEATRGKAQEQEEAERESKEVGAWEPLAAGKKLIKATEPGESSRELDEG